MQLEVLISCMNQKDTSIVQRSKLSGDVLIINQCEKEVQEQIYIGNQRIRMVSTKQRGLSNSRNLAIHLSDRDICLLCDDDEVLKKIIYQLLQPVLKNWRMQILLHLM